jgi:hypothetical protein
MAIIKESANIIFNGANIELKKGNFVDDKSPLVKEFKDLFEVTIVEAKKQKPKRAKKEPKTELLVEVPEEPAELSVEETEPVLETPKRRRRRK